MGDTNEGPPAALFTFFERMPRQGPGSPAVTAGILNRVKHRLPERPVAADMGCGSGAAGIVLAENGIRVCGVAVISEATWFQDPSRVPTEVRKIWRANYEGVGTVSGNLAAAEEQGWRFLHAERLADEVWEIEFNTPMEQVIADVKSSNDADLKVIAAECETEIDVFRRFNAFYGYVYYGLERL